MSTKPSTITSEHTVTAEGLAIRQYLARPVSTTPTPAIALMQEWWGLNPPIKDIAADLSGLAHLSCPMLFFDGEKNQWITVEKMNRLREALAQYGKVGEVKIYDGADHAFFNDTRPEVYSAADAADAWQQTLAFFHQHLP